MKLRLVDSAFELRKLQRTGDRVVSAKAKTPATLRHWLDAVRICDTSTLPDEIQASLVITMLPSVVQVPTK